MNGFECIHCHRLIDVSGNIGTAHRNHCPFCLFSKHVDENVPGDRKATCLAPMEPIGLTFKELAPDKYGKSRVGELMMVHRCTGPDRKIVINRIAADDDPNEIINVFQKSLFLAGPLKKQLEGQGIKLLNKDDEKEIKTQLFGKR